MTFTIDLREADMKLGGDKFNNNSKRRKVDLMKDNTRRKVSPKWYSYGAR
jgi:hypothetical protein